jgi:membrane-bound ClpP family serine protease
MSFFAIIIIILLGIFLLLVEFLIIPGFTIFGVGGFAFIILGIGSAYYFHNIQTGNYTLLGTVILSIATIYFIFKQKTWKNIGLNASINSKNEPFETDKVHQGDLGKTVTRLAPVGKVLVNGIICEAKSNAGFINENTDIEVFKVLNTQIIVKPKT